MKYNFVSIIYIYAQVWRKEGEISKFLNNKNDLTFFYFS